MAIGIAIGSRQSMIADMQYLIAFDKFKGALSANEASSIAREIISSENPTAQIQTAPLTDGGEGFASIIGKNLGGKLCCVTVPGPLLKPVEGKFCLVEAASIPVKAWERLALPEHCRTGKIAFVEMASASGYEALEAGERDPWQTTSYGTRQLLNEAARAGAEALVLGIGGSATNDCGAGALEALGICFYDRELQPVTEICPDKFRLVNTLGSTSHVLNSLPPLRIACDVINPLLGPDGASRVFGPQKGLHKTDFDRMERAIWKMGLRILGLFGRNPAEFDSLLSEPGTGAAGGIGFALRHALPDSAFVEGFPLVSELLDLPSKIAHANCLITGEGRLDQSSLSGKGPVALLKLASPGLKCLIFAGSIENSAGESLRKKYPGLKIYPLSDPSWPLEEALRQTPYTLADKLRKALAEPS